MEIQSNRINWKDHSFEEIRFYTYTMKTNVLTLYQTCTQTVDWKKFFKKRTNKISGRPLQIIIIENIKADTGQINGNKFSTLKDRPNTWTSTRKTVQSSPSYGSLVYSFWGTHFCGTPSSLTVLSVSLFRRMIRDVRKAWVGAGYCDVFQSIVSSASSGRTDRRIEIPHNTRTSTSLAVDGKMTASYWIQCTRVNTKYMEPNILLHPNTGHV